MSDIAEGTEAMQMAATFGVQDLDGAIEALLFVTDEPLSALVIAGMLSIETSDAQERLRNLSQKWEEEDRGIQLREIAGGWRLFTHPRYDQLIENYVMSWDTRKLSAASMEALAIIAYTQPVTRAGVASVRGVNSDSVVTSLIDKGLVREVGTADTPGNPILYGTTKAFLERFGLRSLDDLTDIAEFAPDDDTKRLIEARLSATREDIGLSDEEAHRLAEEMLFSMDAEGAIGEAIEEAAQQMAVDEADALSASASFSSENPQVQEMLREALASTLGLVEKIDFDSLEFNLDDE